jgi:hypothetical protein
MGDFLRADFAGAIHASTFFSGLGRQSICPRLCPISQRTSQKAWIFGSFTVLTAESVSGHNNEQPARKI